MVELCDIYDRNGMKTGETFVRGEPLKEGQYQLATNVWILNSKLEILIQKRSKWKRTSPDIWATHGGCVQAGEDSLQGCIREAYEEIGILLSSEKIRHLKRIVGKNLIMDNYIVIQEFDLTSAVLQPEEVSEIKWVSLKELQSMLEKKEFYKYIEFPCVLQYIQEYKKAQGPFKGRKSLI